jgi:hypothetical protein
MRREGARRAIGAAFAFAVVVLLSMAGVAFPARSRLVKLNGEWALIEFAMAGEALSR